METIDVLLLAALVAIYAGTFSWESAHDTVVAECERLGAFHSGNQIYECRKKSAPG